MIIIMNILQHLAKFTSYFHYTFLYLQTLLKSHAFYPLSILFACRIKYCPRLYKAAIIKINYE